MMITVPHPGNSFFSRIYKESEILSERMAKKGENKKMVSSLGAELSAALLFSHALALPLPAHLAFLLPAS